MPYTISTRDGITIRNIPDDIPPDSQAVKDRVAKARAENGRAEIPGGGVAGDRNVGKPDETPIGEALVGGAEAALSAATGLTTGALGLGVGAVQQMGTDVLGLLSNGRAYVPARTVEQAALAGADSLTYTPRTQRGREMAESLGKTLAQAIPVAGLSGEVAAISRLASPAVSQAVGGVTSAATKAADTVKALRPQVAEATPGTGGSVGAAATDVALQRQATADAMPVPIDLTKGQATRDFEQLRFERETAKNPRAGAAIRARELEQNAQLQGNFEAFLDATGAQATSNIETGRAVVDKALVQQASRNKAEYKIKYREAEKAGQMEDPVSTAPLVDYIQQNASMNAPELAGGSLGLAQRELVRLGGAQMVDGVLQPGELPLKTVELLRRQIGNAIDAAPANKTNMKFGVELKNIIDRETEGLGGNLYKDARKARQRYAQLYEDNAIVRDLLATRRGTADRQVALADVFDKTILNGSRESLGMLRRTLHVDGGEAGKQAWRELQGATVRYLTDEATKGVGMDAAGRPIVSAAKLNNAIRSLDADGKLDFVLSKKGAQQIRDINELSRVIYTTPPGTVNTSNTASVILAALAEAGATGAITGLPVPVLSGLKALSANVKDRRVRARVQDALAGIKPKE